MANKLTIISGPCAIENEETPNLIAARLVELAKEFDFNLVFKGSYKKANRTRLDSFSGIGDEKALGILNDIRKTHSIPVITDIHESHEAELVAEYVDWLQIPAFLCRQTDLLLAAGRTGKVVNVKKGQFSAPESMQFAVDKVKSTGNNKVWLTERGTTFGYQDLVVDFTALPTMQQYAPVILDCTHSLQRPNQTSGVTGGNPAMIATMCKAAIAVGADGLFIETHPNPAEALSDGANQLSLERLPEILDVVMRLRDRWMVALCYCSAVLASSSSPP